MEELPPGSFWAQRSDEPNSFYTVPANLMAKGKYCEVYVAKDQQNAAVLSKVQAIAVEFDKIFPLVCDNFGPPSDVDGNGKIVILLLDIIDGYTSGGSYTAGYFQPMHCLSGPGYDHSNRKDMIFMDTNPGIPGDATFNMTLAHEFQHLVNFNRTYILGGRKQFDVWINEGLSSAAEYLYMGSHIQKKIDYYKDEMNKHWDIHNGINFVTWTPKYAADPFSSYSTVYLFFQWLRIHTDETVFKQIFTNPYMDYRAIPFAVGIAMGNGWQEILVNWFQANAKCDPSGIYGYKNEIFDLQKDWNPKTVGGLRDLYPGEGVYVNKSEVEGKTTAGNLYYKIIDGSRGVIVNTNGTPGGSKVSLTLAGTALEKTAGTSAVGARSLGSPPAHSSDPLPVDRVFRLPE